jgi:acetyltransferase-like isoleucine patch superfamily enzyme
MLVAMDARVKAALRARGVENFQGVQARISDSATFEPPCSIKWMRIESTFFLGAFSYAVRGFFSAVRIGRYTSMGEEVQVGRANHAMTWVTTSPFLYLRQKLFDVDQDFEAASDYHAYLPPPRPGAKVTQLRETVIGSDVYVGHGAFIKPGVTVGDGAIIGAMAVVTKDVPPYAVVAGNPARVVKMRMTENLVESFLRSQWWRFAPWQFTHIDFSKPEEAAPRLEEFAATAKPYAPRTVRLGDLAERA